MISFDQFKRSISVSPQDICRDVLCKNREAIKVKNEEVAVKNLMRIFEATLELSNQIGFQSMSVRDLSKRTALSMGALYSYVESKERLLCMLLQFGGALGELARKHTEDDSNSALDHLSVIIARHIYLSEIYHPWFLFIFMEAKFLNKKANTRILQEEEANESYCRQLLEAGCQSGVMTMENPVLIASTINALLQDWYLKREKYRTQKVNSEQYAEFVCGLVNALVNKD